MNFALDELKAILAKSLLLIQKSTNTLTQLDHWRFPTPSSETARDLLLDAYKRLCNPPALIPADPAVLYNRLFSIQDLLGVVERSSTDRISWPLVSYCDEIWKQLFDPKKVGIFYSVTSEHNYSILRFSRRLAVLLKDVLPSKELAFIQTAPELYCLQLASAEDANLPLYANIGHEFGHAVFDFHRPELITELNDHFQPILPLIASALRQADANKAASRFRRTASALISTAQELFCDLVGAKLMGPAFFLSLYEIAWGQSKETSWIRLSPDTQHIRAYPSFHFRLYSIRKWAMIDDFCDKAISDFAKLDPALQVLAGCLKTVPTSHGTDLVKVLPSSDEDAALIAGVVQAHFSQMKSAFDAFLSKSSDMLKTWYPNLSPAISTREIGELLHRLENNILPNIVPSETNPLLGEPASFQAILNACALFRLQLLTSKSPSETRELIRRTAIVERLTGKAFEVSFIQHEFNRR